MTGQLKQRIIGIVVLVFLALIILPWLFGSNQSAVFEEKKPAETLTGGDLPETVREASPAKPQPDNTLPPSQASLQETSSKQYAEDDKLDIIHPSSHPSPTKTTVANNNKLTTKTSVPSKPNDSVTRVTEMNASKINSIQNSIVHSQPQQKNLTAQNTKIKTVSDEKKKTAFKKAPPITKVVSKKIENKTSAKGVTIQLGSFSNKANAEKLVQQLKAKGYPAYCKTSKNTVGKSATRVLVGPEVDRHAAQAAINKIEKTLKVHGVIVKGTPV